MNFNYILFNKVNNLLDSKKAFIPENIYNFYKENYLTKTLKIQRLKDLKKEILCLKNVLNNYTWYSNYNIKITKDDTYLLRGYNPISFMEEIENPQYFYYDHKKIDSLCKISYEELNSLSHNIILKIKNNGIDICDGYHRVISMLKKKHAIELICSVGIFKT